MPPHVVRVKDDVQGLVSSRNIVIWSMRKMFHVLPVQPGGEEEELGAPVVDTGVLVLGAPEDGLVEDLDGGLERFRALHPHQDGPVAVVGWQQLSPVRFSCNSLTCTGSFFLKMSSTHLMTI